MLFSAKRYCSRYLRFPVSRYPPCAVFRPLKFNNITDCNLFGVAMSMSTTTATSGESVLKEYDFVVIGGGSAGMATGRAAASYGKKVALVEKQERLGGTCVNVGCVPKKVMWNAATVAETIHDAKDYGFSGLDDVKFSFEALKAARDKYIKRLNGIYSNNLKKSDIDCYYGTASFSSAHTITVGDSGVTLKSPHILIGVGGSPSIPDNVQGAELGCTSDDFFNKLEHLPEKVAVVGAGYIAVEMAGVLNALGSKVDLIIRHHHLLRHFDRTITDMLMTEMKLAGVNLIEKTEVHKVTKQDDNTLTLYTDDNREIGSQYDCLLWAIGRHPNTKTLSLEKAGVKLNSTGHVEVDENHQTNVEGIYGVGDVIGKVDLTPVAIHMGRKLARRLFNDEKDVVFDYDTISSVIFSHPPIGTVGLSECEAIEKYGEDNVKIHQAKFTNMYYSVLERRSSTLMKMICVGDDEKVVGLHGIGLGLDEMIQGFALAVKMGVTRAQFHTCIPIHPTASEEMVLL